MNPTQEPSSIPHQLPEQRREAVEVVMRLKIRMDDVSDAIKLHMDSADAQVRRSIRIHMVQKEFPDAENVEDMHRRFEVFKFRVCENTAAILRNKEGMHHNAVVSAFVKAASDRVKWLAFQKTSL